MDFCCFSLLFFYLKHFTLIENFPTMIHTARRAKKTTNTTNTKDSTQIDWIRNVYFAQWHKQTQLTTESVQCMHRILTPPPSPPIQTRNSTTILSRTYRIESESTKWGNCLYANVIEYVIIWLKLCIRWNWMQLFMYSIIFSWNSSAILSMAVVYNLCWWDEKDRHRRQTRRSVAQSMQKLRKIQMVVDR